MNTVNYACGCSVTWSMFGDREIMAVQACAKHAAMLQVSLLAAQRKILGLQEDGDA